ncbi:hypothetical protein GCM10011357_11250 [Lacimicrobium alkaliphilum]|uniref:Uncharacterized protein n=2 Tax=Lacimicrobium alkaliphilum TaxID=1526571 RepID=A0ABQ1R457_9ALTE|nr:hypothetical protein GCM10011357_11250 [Lacimicrobium alkaliphilum]
MIELLVTLVLLGLIAAVAAPGLESWLAAREAASQRSALAGELALLPLKTSRSGNSILIENSRQLETPDLDVDIIRPIQVLGNGYCRGGEIVLRQGPRRYRFDVMAPYCALESRQDLQSMATSSYSETLASL